ncbi:hypothetical protein E2C01_045994 [Portunus trituberculatus]|uniref:Uncharacterized protein n=1 Tax=Portunus trituberculatus TaxID=210409 RepID=A0A5B7G4E8_PORTR|nr:hypothetical protein [Portunus trituberculatus]
MIAVPTTDYPFTSWLSCCDCSFISCDCSFISCDCSFICCDCSFVCMNRSSLSWVKEAAQLILIDTAPSSEMGETAQLLLAATAFPSAQLTKLFAISLLLISWQTTYRCIPNS